MKRLRFNINTGRREPHREPPAAFDPLATYDALYRKQPKKFGAIEGFRALPWLIRYFTKKVPDDFWMLDRDCAVVACLCKTETPPVVPFNQLVECTGEGCGRWFFFDGVRVLVARNAEGSDAVAPEPSTPVSS